MRKKAFVGATALMIAGSTIVYAQQRPEAPDASTEDKGAVADARAAAPHAGLKLNADQEKIWPAFEQALHDLDKMRMDRFAVARDQQPSSDPVQRLQRLADAFRTRGTTLKSPDATLGPLYQSFDEGQKR